MSPIGSWHSKCSFHPRTLLGALTLSSSSDISNENVPVDFEEGQSGLEVKGVAFKSWEYSKTVTCKSKQNLKDAGFSGWFDRQFDLYWALEYEEAGIPTVVDEFKRKIGH
ncbi:hypothetical protein EV360DRAFT_90732 [Lentinula raphanica]|nr:hypothetical protein EV360DRAFT_90732 [Lentinula raphanica]